MRKGAGISALSRHTAVNSSYSTLSSSISASQLASLQQSLEGFRSALVSFSAAHRGDIRADPAFRHQFQKMCAALGVDPLAGASKGGRGGAWWSELVGIAEWEYELAVQVVDVCVSSRSENGGMIAMTDLIRRVERLRSGGLAKTSTSTSPTTTASSKKGKNTAVSGEITQEDILRSLDILRPLGAGYTLHTPTSTSMSTTPSSTSTSTSTGRTTYVRTIPRSLDTDQSILLALAAAAAAGVRGLLRPREVRRQTGWADERVQVALDDCVLREGIGWVDEQAPGGGDVWIIAATEFDE